MTLLMKKPVIVSAIAALLISGVGLTYWLSNRKPPYIDVPKNVSEQTVKKTEEGAKTEDEGSQGQTSQTLSQIGKPNLSKSSGNNAPVPAKALIQFTCSGIPDSSCVVTLTNQDNSNDNLKFEAKTIKDDGRGNVAVSWIWEAKPGTWTVKATLSKNGYQPNSSDPQTLKVNP